MVQYGILSDLHGNKPALDTVWRHLVNDHDVDETIVVGDIVGVLGWPEEVAYFVKENVDHAIYGNHDAYVREDHTYTPEHPSQKQEHKLVTGRLTKETAQWLNKLPEQITLLGGDIVVGHAKPWSNNICGHPADNYLDMGDWIEWSANTEEFEGQLVIIGHTHIQGKLDLRKFDSQRGKILNPGSVGAPYYKDAKYAIYNSDSGEIELHRAHYDTSMIKERLNTLGLKSASELNTESMY